MIADILEAARQYLEQKTGLNVLWDPQPVKSAKPHLRLTYTGCEDQGDGHDRLSFQASILGAGSGPGKFLESVIQASLALNDLYKDGKCRSDIKIGEYAVRLSFLQTASSNGQFVQNENPETETSTWAYVWQEPRVFTLDFDSRLRRH